MDQPQNPSRPDAVSEESGVPAAAPGVTVLDDWDGMGQRTTASGTVRLDDVEVAPQLVVPHHRTYEAPTVHGAFAQLLHAAIDAGLARGALREAGEFVRTRARPWRDADVEDEGAGAPHGPRALPGNYQVKLTLDGNTLSQPLQIEMDPRTSATQAELKEQLRLSLEMFDEVRSCRRTLAEIGDDRHRVATCLAYLFCGAPSPGPPSPGVPP